MMVLCPTFRLSFHEATEVIIQHTRVKSRSRSMPSAMPLAVSHRNIVLNPIRATSNDGSNIQGSRVGNLGNNIRGRVLEEARSTSINPSNGDIDYYFKPISFSIESHNCSTSFVYCSSTRHPRIAMIVQDEMPKRQNTKQDSWWTGSQGVLNRFKASKTVFEPVHVVAKDSVP